MNSEIKPCRSLPPLVEGKIHGSLKFVINEILWIRKNPGDVTIVTSWWGEHDNAQFRLINGITDATGTNENTTQIYAIKTNATLFEHYIKNSETIKLVIVAEETHSVIGKAHVEELFKIFLCKRYSQFVPILNNSGNKIGKIHVSLQLTYMTKLPNIQLKTCDYTQKQVDNTLLSDIDDLQYNREISMKLYENMDDIKGKSFIKYVNLDTYDTYNSVLKTKRQKFQGSRKKFNEIVTNKLATQVAAKAQRLREEMLKETYNEDPLTLSDSSEGTEMTSSGEKKALNTLKLTSPTSSLIDLASKTITANKDDNTNIRCDENSLIKLSIPVEGASYKEMTYRTHLLDHIDSIRIFIESFTLSSTGYRRIKSMCKQYDVSLLPTYFIQYDTAFAFINQTNMKTNKETKFIRTRAKKQVGQVIDFNFEGIYIISRYILNTSFPLRFKIFGRHLNQKLPTELGFGSMNINDITKTANLSSTQHIVITNKGIKMGELKVTAELGYNFTYFGKEFVDAVIAAKENIPILEMKFLTSMDDNKYKSVTGTHSSKSSKISSVSNERIEYLTNNSNKDLITTKNIAEHQEQSLDNKKIDTSNPETSTNDKILLHGLIYIAEGKDLPDFNTYLICRAFWREDKATSQICSNTKNPFYHFFQLISLIHGTELLNKVRDNYIIIEVYSQQKNGSDNLLGIAKLSVHQLYIAYRDPLILPHLLLSKYPVISVDGWVSINNPVNGKLCGELLALVALGTAEQIALLEVSRGLRNTISHTVYNYHCCIPDNTSNTMSGQENLQYNIPEALNLNSEQSTHYNNFTYHINNIPDQDSVIVDYKTQESQTDVSNLKDARSEKSVQKAELSKHLVLHTLVDRLANVLHVDKNSIDQSVQTDMNPPDKGKADEEELHLNILNSNNLTDDSDSCSPTSDIQLPTEIYRSVGVGAEYDENCQQSNNVYDFSNLSIMERDTEREKPNTNSNSSFFRSVIEIECALHLPKIKGLNESIEPSTYVTFQDFIHKFDSSDQLSSYTVTNVFLHSCNPKWNWKCDTKLPTELLLNSQKRLIFKVWHLSDPETSIEINLERDIVIGFSAVDLSVLLAGFPTISGWFHIMDFVGKCNGQIKITITPLDSQLLRKFTLNTSTTNLSECNNLSQTNWPHLYNTPCNNAKSNKAHQILSYTSHNKDRFIPSNRKPNDFVDVGYSLEDVSMSFLSSSLKQKLTELDEITKRLQSRLRDVTNGAFEDEFDNDFDMIELNSDNENIDDRNIEIVTSQCTVSVYSANETLEVSKYKTESDQNVVNNENKQTSSIISNNYNPHFELSFNQSKTISSEATDKEYCSSSNTRFNRHSDYYHNRYQNRHSLTHNYLSDNNIEYPARGTKTHINYLLDKLSLDLPPKPPSGATIPMKKDILELFASLREHKNNSQDKYKNDYCINTCSVLTQTDNMSEQHAYFQAENLAISDTTIGENVPKSLVESQPCNRISTLIREELIAEENNDNMNYDELTTYLITSNVRHMDQDNIFNPLLYQHLMPDLQVVAAISSEGEAAEQLDNRYTNFGAIHDNKIKHSTGNDILSCNDMQLKSWTNVLQSEKNMELLHLIPSGVLENVDNSIDITVTYKSNNNDLTSGNSTESIASASFDKPLIQADIKSVNYCSTISELSVTRVLRQAPEGGNPEEVKISMISKQQNDTQDISQVN